MQSKYIRLQKKESCRGIDSLRAFIAADTAVRSQCGENKGRRVWFVRLGKNGIKNMIYVSNHQCCGIYVQHFRVFFKLESMSPRPHVHFVLGKGRKIVKKC